MPTQTEQQALQTSGDSLETALLAFSQVTHQDLSKNRFAEEREWYENALFYQRRQWLKWDNSNKRWSLIKPDPDKPRPMPVTNHYARTINATANQLSSGELRVGAIPLDDSDRNRRAAEFAEKACKAIDKESDFRILRPLLGKHTTLWGVGVTYDYYDVTESNGVTYVPDVQVATEQMLGCLDCANVTNVNPDLAGSPGAPVPQQQGMPCPACGSMQTVNWKADTPVVSQVKKFSKGRIRTEVVPIFEVFYPRDCQNPNLARKIQRKRRIPLSKAKQLWPDTGADLQADTKMEIHEIYLEALKSLVNYNYMHDQGNEQITIVETWVEFGQIPEKLQELLREAVQAQDLELEDGVAPAPRGDGFSDNGADNPNEGTTGEIDRDPTQSAQGGDDEPDSDDDIFEAPDAELDPIEQLEQWGIFLICGGGKVLDWGINNLEGKSPYTFWLWEMDPANPYPKGLGVDLVPLQKRLNRLDSLMELGIMSNAAGKWLWPTTQTTKPPTGTPSDVVEFDPIGDGKIAPSFVQPSPFHQACFSLRAMILQDFQQIGLNNGVQTGSSSQGVTAFRGLAYLGAKADEQLSTQRFLWESAAVLRYEKCLILAKHNWQEERKVKVAGFNGRYGMQALLGQSLDGQYLVEIKPNSSRPQTSEEKQSAIQMLLEGGLIDPTDPAVREYIVDIANLDNLNLANHLQYLKAERDLDLLLAGQMPEDNPFVDPAIFLKVFSDYMLTEEYEQQAPQIKQLITMATQMFSQQVQQAQMAQMAQAAAAGAVPGSPAAKLAGAMGKQQNSKPGLEGVPGVTVNVDNTGQEALGEASQVASALP